MKFSDIGTYLNKILVFYFPSKAGYWNSLTHCNISDKPAVLGSYFLDFSSKANYPEKFTSDGIPLFSNKGQPEIEHPIVIAQYGLGIYELLGRTDFINRDLKNKFLNIAEWFLSNKVSIEEGSGWLIKNLYPNYGLNSPWISAMAQGEAISVLTRAAKLSQNSKFEKLAIEAIVPFKYNVSEGGVRNYFNSLLIYEEFPSPIKPMAVLNGYIFSLFGLFDLYLLNGNKKAKDLFKEGVQSLKKLLPYYDIKFWTQYFLYNHPQKYFSSFTYHMLVTEQLKALYIITEEKTFYQYYQLWNNYSNSFISKTRALVNKVIFSNKVFL